MARSAAAAIAAALILASAAAWLADVFSPAAPPAEADEPAAATARGIVIRTEAPVYATGGEVMILAREGSRVSAGGAAAAVSETRAGLMQAVRECAKADPTFARECAYRAVYAAATGDVSGAVPLAALYEPENAESFTIIRAETSSLWSEHTDGLEYLAPESLDGCTKQDVEALLALMPAETGAVGKLVTGSSWSFAALCSEELEVGAECTLRFEDFEARASVKESGSGFAVFTSREHLADALALRQCTVEIIPSDSQRR